MPLTFVNHAQPSPPCVVFKEDLQKLTYEANAVDKFYNHLQNCALHPKRLEGIFLAVAHLCSKLECCRSKVVINVDAPYIKMLSKQFDRCHGTLLQYVEFLCSAVSPASSYGVLIPSLNDLVHLYLLYPEVQYD
ncbi:hypothetical protein RIF29_03583 [Crotalaria pallida]|uniref:Uncharacterized protein n=1 Tax=Crotalaria pallida TaxID=3830 RepID=A0AAN9J2K0_CROPI